MSWTGKWDGGRIWTGKDGSTTFWIRKQIQGKWFEFSTRTTNLRAALRELDRLERDPDGFNAAPPDSLVLTDDLINQFVEAGVRKKNSEGRLWKKRYYMDWWKDRLEGDLRKVQLHQLIELSKQSPCPDNAKSILKVFWSWLVAEAKIEKNTAQPLKLSPSRPAQEEKSKVIPRSSHNKMLEVLDKRWVDALVVLAGTGWHVSELERLSEVRMLQDSGIYKAKFKEGNPFVLKTKQKSGDFHQTLVSRKVAEAALRFLQRGDFNRVMFYRSVKAGCEQHGVEPFTPGCYRHTIASRAVEQGVSPERVSAFLGHRSSATTKRFYSVHAVAPKIPTLETSFDIESGGSK